MTQPYPQDDAQDWNPIDCPNPVNIPDAWKDHKVTVTFEVSIRDALDYDNHNRIFELFWPAYKNSVLADAHKRGLRGRAD